jgi:hypothetical protein
MTSQNKLQMLRRYRDKSPCSLSSIYNCDCDAQRSCIIIAVCSAICWNLSLHDNRSTDTDRTSAVGSIDNRPEPDIRCDGIKKDVGPKNIGRAADLDTVNI